MHRNESSNDIRCSSVHEIKTDGGRPDNSHSINDRNREISSAQHNSDIDQKKDGRGKYEPGEDPALANAESPDHYIYVAYPPELKRRLLERFFLFYYIVALLFITEIHFFK